MKRVVLLLTTTLLLTICSNSMAQTYQWGLPKAVDTTVAVQPFPNIPDQKPYLGRLATAKSFSHRSIRKVTWPSAPTAQVWMPPAPIPIYPASRNSQMYAAVTAKMMWQKAGISLHTDQLGLSSTSALGEFGISLVDPGLFKIRYSVTTQQAVEETPAVTSALQIGAAQLVSLQAGAGQAAPVAGAAAAGTPINLRWQVGPSHRIDVVCIQSKQGPQNFWLSPAIVANWIPFQITGSTTTGTVVSATETFNNFYWGGGLEMVYQQPQSRISALVAGSDKYLLADCSLAYSMGNNLDLTFGWQGRQVKLERDTVMRLTAPTLGVLVRF